MAWTFNPFTATFDYYATATASPPTATALTTPDGSTVTYTVPAHTVGVLILNGVVQQAGGVDYTDNGTSITYVTAPLGTSDNPTAWHQFLSW